MRNESRSSRFSGRVIAIAGAHNRYATDYLRRAAEVIAETGADNVGGAVICESESKMQKAIAAAHHSRFSTGGALWRNPDYEGPADTVFGGIYRREIFDHIGFFDEELVRNQDDEFNLRLVRAGGKIWQSPRVRSWYQPRRSLALLFWQQMQYGYWKVRVIQKHRILVSVRHLVPSLFVGLLATIPFLAMLWRPLVSVCLGLVGLYLVCSVLASIATAAQHGWRVLPVMPAVFGCYHIGYGLGFLRGIGDFGIRGASPGRTWTDLSRATAVKPSQASESDGLKGSAVSAAAKIEGTPTS